MQSNKWTFSLACFVMLLTIGFVSVSPVFGDAKVLGKDFDVTFGITDVSEGGGTEVQLPTSPAPLLITITLAKEVETAGATEAAGTLEAGDFTYTFYDEDGLLKGGTAPTISSTLRKADNTAPAEAGTSAKKYVLSITDGFAAGDTVVVTIAKDVLTNANRADVIESTTLHDGGYHTLGKNRAKSTTINVVEADSVAPQVLAVERVTPATVSGFTPAGVRGAFDVRIVLSEGPKAFTAADHIAVTNGKVDSVIAGVATDPNDEDDDGTENNGPDSNGEGVYANDLVTTGRDDKVYPYLVRITPDLKNADDIVISVKTFDDKVLPTPLSYLVVPDVNNPGTRDDEVLVVEVDTTVVKADSTAHENTKTQREGKLPHEKFLVEVNDKGELSGSDLVIPAGGFLVLAQGDAAQSGVRDAGPDKFKDDANRTPVTGLSAAQHLYNVTHGFAFVYPGDDLQNYFRNGATIKLVYKDIAGNTGSEIGKSNKTGYLGTTSATITAGDVLINEIMWGRDRGLDEGADRNKSQWIELHNTTAADIHLDPFEWILAFGDTSSLETGGVIVDAVGNDPPEADGGYWTQPGSSGVSQATVEIPGAGVIQDLVSMVRKADTTDAGMAQASWADSILPSANTTGQRDHIATPGAANNYMSEMMDDEEDDMEEDMEEEDMEEEAMVATASDIMISEIMVASNDGRLPQWIELVSTSAMDLSLAGWSVVIDNSDDDADVHGAGAQIQVDIGDVMVGAGETVLLVSKEGRNSGVDEPGVMRTKGDANAGNLDADRIVDLSDTLMPSNVRYTVLSEMGFTITLMPPQTGAIRMSGDTVGNLGEGWDIPMAESGRSSIVRREMGVDMMAIMGTAEKGWVLASGTALVGAYVSTYYGSDEDVGTPGYDAGGPLPVELSNFYPARDKVTGQVVITWETQSELNNAGFFIKRSEQPDGKFLVINPTMIPGAGTTAEKQSYTHTDTTAKPNVLYYYQIEDVSLDGKRATLTGAHRLRGHIGAAGKVTTIWGELKAQE